MDRYEHRLRAYEGCCRRFQKWRKTSNSKRASKNFNVKPNNSVENSIVLYVSSFQWENQQKEKKEKKSWHFLSIPTKVIFSNGSALKDRGLFFFLELSSITVALKFPQVGHLLFWFLVSFQIACLWTFRFRIYFNNRVSDLTCLIHLDPPACLDQMTWTMWPLKILSWIFVDFHQRILDAETFALLINRTQSRTSYALIVYQPIIINLFYYLGDLSTILFPFFNVIFYWVNFSFRFHHLRMSMNFAPIMIVVEYLPKIKMLVFFSFLLNFSIII